MFILKLDTLGNVIWAKSAGGDKTTCPVVIALDTPEYIYVSGSFNSDTLIIGNDTLFCSSHSYPYEDDVFIAKYDNNGNAKWAKQAGGVELDQGTCMHVDGNNNIFIGGFFDNAYIVFGNDTLFNYNSNGGEDLFIVKYDTTGNVIWAKSSGGNGSDRITSITEDNFGNIRVAGYFNSPSLNFGNILLNNSMQDWTNDIFVANLSSLAGIYVTSKNDDIMVYPNPANNNINILSHQQSTLEILNIQGQTVLQEQILQEKTNIDISGFAKGIYILRLYSNDKTAVIKIVKE